MSSSELTSSLSTTSTTTGSLWGIDPRHPRVSDHAPHFLRSFIKWRLPHPPTPQLAPTPRHRNVSQSAQFSRISPSQSDFLLWWVLSTPPSSAAAVIMNTSLAPTALFKKTSALRMHRIRFAKLFEQINIAFEPMLHFLLVSMLHQFVLPWPEMAATDKKMMRSMHLQYAAVQVWKSHYVYFLANLYKVHLVNEEEGSLYNIYNSEEVSAWRIVTRLKALSLSVFVSYKKLFHHHQSSSSPPTWLAYYYNLYHHDQNDDDYDDELRPHSLRPNLPQSWADRHTHIPPYFPIAIIIIAIGIIVIIIIIIIIISIMVSEHSENTQKTLKEHTENTQRTHQEHY